MTFLYGFPHHLLQKYLGKEVGHLNSFGIDPWIIIGDLNKLSSSQDKLAAHERKSSRYKKI